MRFLSFEWSTGWLRRSIAKSSSCDLFRPDGPLEPTFNWLFLLFAGFWSFLRRPPAIALAWRRIVNFLADLEDFRERLDLAEVNAPPPSWSTI